MSNCKVLTIFLREANEVLEPLTPTQVGEVFLALINYFANGVVPEFDEPIVKLVFNVLKGANERNCAKNKARSEAMKGNKNAMKVAEPSFNPDDL